MIILLCGYKGCGKDTFAKYIESKYIYKHFKFASGLKSSLKLLFSFDDDQLESRKDTVDERWDITPRDAMIFVGTHMFQHEIQRLLPSMKKNFWVKQVCDQLDPRDDIVISDLRFVHEYEYMRDHFPDTRIKVVKISNPNLFIYQKDNEDSSETEHLQIPLNDIVMNDESYYASIDALIRAYSSMS